VDLAANIAVKSVRVFNRFIFGQEHWRRRLGGAKVSFWDNAGKLIYTSSPFPNMENIRDINITLGLSSSTTSVVAWKYPSPTGEPLLSDACKTQLKAHFRLNNDIFDTSIALVFGNKTTIGQVCSFAKGLTSTIVSRIPGFCCLDAPYQSKIEYWGEKVSSWMRE
jgi:hypothetical protein